MAKSASNYLVCPLCDAEIPVEEEPKVGGELYCPLCESPLRIKKTKDDVIYLQEDF